MGPTFDRRQMLRIGGVSLAATALDLFGQRATAAPESRTSVTADQVLFLWLPGGVTHHESFDPKPDAPAEIRGELTAIPTSVPGVRFCEVLPLLARQMHR